VLFCEVFVVDMMAIAESTIIIATTITISTTEVPRCRSREDRFIPVAPGAVHRAHFTGWEDARHKPGIRH
jgi:hypothetical protein